MFGGSAPDAPPLVPMPEGRGYRIESPPAESMVTPRLAEELKRVLEWFAGYAGFDERRPVSVRFGRGIFGHHRVGRAADIYGIGGVGLETWKTQWDHKAQPTNLGWRLYKTMADRGRWSQPYGYPIQLFGPWTRTEGPWKYISDRLLHAHRDHVHVAK